jgi:hypothetical protein
MWWRHVYSTMSFSEEELWIKHNCVNIHTAVEGLYCKRPTQCLAPSKILTLHPLTASRVFTPHRLWCRGRTHSLGGEGVGGQYFGRRQTLLCTLHTVCKYFVHTAEYAGSGGRVRRDTTAPTLLLHTRPYNICSVYFSGFCMIYVDLWLVILA